MISKYVVVLLNVLMLVVGALVLTLGLWGMNVGSQVSHLVSLTTPTLVMLLGVITILVALWGIYAAVNEDPLLMQIVPPPSRLLLTLVFGHHGTSFASTTGAVKSRPCPSSRY